MTAKRDVTYNEATNRYEMLVGNLMVYADVRKDKSLLYIKYVFAPQELRGTGAAGEFMRKLMGVVRTEALKVVPVCSYAANWLRQNNEYQDLLSR